MYAEAKFITIALSKFKIKYYKISQTSMNIDDYIKLLTLPR